MKTLKAQIGAMLFLVFSLMAPLRVTATEPPKAYEPSELDVQPRPIKRISPIYPAKLKRRDITGSALIEFVIDQRGTVIWAKGLKFTHPEFEKAGIDAILQWKFVPGRKDGAAAPMKGTQLLTFNLGAPDISKPDVRRKGQAQSNAAPVNATPADLAEIFAPTELDEMPQPISRVSPVFPAEMKGAGFIGNVTVGFVIDTSGRVINPIILAANNPWFERAAIDAIMQWQFRPGSKGGQVVNTRMKQLLSFDLEGGGSSLWGARQGKEHNKLPLEIRWDKPPEPIASTFPVYPTDALLAKRTGHAIVSFLVNPEGQVKAIKLEEASAPEFAASAIASLDAWEFEPAMRAGAACSAFLRLKFNFIPGGDSTVPVREGMRRIAQELSRKEPRICTAGKLDALPKPISRRAPIYPSALLVDGRAGEALIEFYIDEKGDAQLPRIVSATAPEFGYAAAQAVAAWRFEEPRKGGEPVIAHVQIPVNFEAPAEKKQLGERILDEKQR